MNISKFLDVANDLQLEAAIFQNQRATNYTVEIFENNLDCVCGKSSVSISVLPIRGPQAELMPLRLQPQSESV